jgi:HlyD family secretion protein
VLSAFRISTESFTLWHALGRLLAPLSRRAMSAIPLAAILVLQISHSLAADSTEASQPPGMAVTVIKPSKTCLTETLGFSGVLVPREEVLVRPDREGMRISRVDVESGDTVASGQVLASLTPSDNQQSGGTGASVQAPVAGIVSRVAAVIGTTASARGEPLFRIIARGEFELLADVSTKQLSRLSDGLPAKIKVMGIGELPGKVRLVSTSIDAITQLGQVRVFIGKNEQLRVGTFARADITLPTEKNCGVAIPISAVLYTPDGAVVQVVHENRIETREVTVGQLSHGEAEIREGLGEGDVVVARAGAFLREGDLVRPIPSLAQSASRE